MKVTMLGTGAAFVDPDRWLCATATDCSPVVGSKVVYFDNSHVSASYAATIRTAVWNQILAAKP